MNIPNDYHSSIYSDFSGRNVRIFCNVEFNFQRSQTEVDSKNYLFALSGVKTLILTLTSMNNLRNHRLKL